MLFQVVDDQKTRCFGIALFCRTSAVGGLEPKDQRFCCPLTGGQTTMYMGNVYCVLTVSPFAPPTHDWFHQSRAGESFWNPSYCICVDWIMESRKFSPRLAMSTSVYTMTLSICTWHWNLPIAALPAIGFRHAWHQLQKMKNKHRAREYAPALSRQGNETQTAVKIQLTMHCISDSIIS